MSSLSTHVLDGARGEPAVGVRVELLRADGDTIGSGDTDSDGRVAGLAPGELVPGSCRLVFATGNYFAARGETCFYPEVTITFTIDDERQYHVPLLLSPYAFSTYRGS